MLQNTGASKTLMALDLEEKVENNRKKIYRIVEKSDLASVLEKRVSMVTEDEMLALRPQTVP